MAWDVQTVARAGSQHDTRDVLNCNAHIRVQALNTGGMGAALDTKSGAGACTQGMGVLF